MRLRKSTPEYRRKTNERNNYNILNILNRTLAGSLGGILVASKLTNYRLEQLEKKVDKHNQFAERIPVLENRMTVSEHRIKDLESER